MTLILHLSPETEAQLKAAADAAGQDVNTYAVATLVEAVERDTAEWGEDEAAAREIAAAFERSEAEMKAGGRLHTVEELGQGVDDALAAIAERDAIRQRATDNAAVATEPAAPVG